MPGNANKLEPWDTNSQKEEGFPQVSGTSPGSWGRPGSPDSARPGTGLCGLECDEPYAQRNTSPNLRQRYVLANRDKESLLEEIIDLKKALSDQAYHLKLHKVHHSAVQLENRKLEKDVEDLEVAGNLEAPRTGGPTRLRAKLQGANWLPFFGWRNTLPNATWPLKDKSRDKPTCKVTSSSCSKLKGETTQSHVQILSNLQGLRTRLGDLQSTCDLQHDELCLLRRDIRVAHTRECEVERDVYAAEICRLQKVVKRLKALQFKITNENQELSRLKDKAARLKFANQRLESCIVTAHRTLEKANKEVVTFREKALESTKDSKKTATKLKELQDHAAKLEQLLEKERKEKQRIELKIKEIAQKKKEWDRQWEADQKRKAQGEAEDALKQAKKRKKPEVRKDRGAHASAGTSSDESSSSDDGKSETKMDKRKRQDELDARKRETLEKLEQKKTLMMKKVRDLSHAFVTEEQKHHDRLFAQSGSPTSVSSGSSKDRGREQEIERSLYEGLDGATLDFMDEVEDIHYGSTVPEPNLEGLSEKETAAAKAKYAKEVAEALEKKKERGTGSRPGSPSSGTSGTSGRSGFSDDSDDDDSEGYSGGGPGQSWSKKDFKYRIDREGGKNSKKMNPKKFEEQKAAFLNKAMKASKVFFDKEHAHYDKILSEIESGVRTPGSVGWFSSTSSISTEDKQTEQVFENEFCQGVEGAADMLLDRLEDVQYGSKGGKVPKLKLQDLKAQEDRYAKEREGKMLELERLKAEVEEKARKKVEKETAERWASGQNKIEVMIDKEMLDEDEYSAEVKQVKGRLSVEINLKRTDDHPYVGSPKAQEEERRREEEAAQERQQAEYQQQMEEEAEERERQEKMERQIREKKAKEEAQRHAAQLEAQRDKNHGLTTEEETRRKELQAKWASGIPLTDEEEAELKALRGKIRGQSGLTSREEQRLKELEAKIAAGIPLTDEEEAEFKKLKSKLRGKSGLTGGEEARLRELQAKLKSGIPLTDEEEAELNNLKRKIIKKSGLSGSEEDRLKELEEKIRRGIKLSAEEEAELRALRARLVNESGLTSGEELRLEDLEAKLNRGERLTAEEEAELKKLRARFRGKSGLTQSEEDRLKELEDKIRRGIPLTAAEEAELNKLRKNLKTQLTSSDEESRKQLEAKLAAGIPLSEEEERELRELQAKRWGEWPLSAAEDARRKELEDKLRNGIPLTPEEEEELRRLQAKIKLKFPNTELGEVDMSRSEEMRQKGKLPFIDTEMQGFIKENIRGVLGHLENITEVIVKKQEKLKAEAGEHLASTAGAAMDILKASEGSSPSTPRSKGGGSKPGTPRGEKPKSPHVEKGEHSRFGRDSEES